MRASRIQSSAALGAASWPELGLVFESDSTAGHPMSLKQCLAGRRAVIRSGYDHRVWVLLAGPMLLSNQTL